MSATWTKRIYTSQPFRYVAAVLVLAPQKARGPAKPGKQLLDAVMPTCGDDAANARHF